MPSPISERLALLAGLLSSACGCARNCPRCSMRAIDRAAGRQPGHCAAIVAGSQTDLTTTVAASYAGALGVSPAWLAYGLGVCVDPREAHHDHYGLDPSDATHHAALGAHLLDALGRATLRAEPTPTAAVRPQRRTPRTVRRPKTTRKRVARYSAGEARA